jgi:hypothetical protein
MTEEKHKCLPRLIDDEECEYIVLLHRALTKIRNSDNYPDYQNFLNTSQKYKLISLFLDPKHRKTVKSAAKNHHQLKRDKMNYLLIEAIINLFIQICKLTDDPLAPWEKDHRMSPGAFKRLIEGRDADYEELVEELEKLKEKNLKGYIKEEIYDKYKAEKQQEIKEYQKQTEKYKMKLQEQEKYYKEKLEKVSQRHQKTQKHLSKQIQDQSNDIENCDKQTHHDSEADDREVVYY